MRMTKFRIGLSTVATLLLSSGVVRAATQEQFTNLVTALPVLALVSIFAIWLLSEIFKK